MKVFVLWSGGLDSTYLIQKLLVDPKYTEVHAGIVNLENNKEQMAAQFAAIKKMLPIFSKNAKFKYKNTIFSCEVIKVDSTLDLKQPPLWITACAYFATEYDEIAISYVMGDGAISFLPEISKLYSAYKNLSRYSAEFAKLTYPLKKLNKEIIWDNLGVNLKDKVTWCESPNKVGRKYVSCCDYENCPSCERMKFMLDK